MQLYYIYIQPNNLRLGDYMLKLLNRLNVINRLTLLVTVPIISILIISIVNYINLQQMHKQLQTIYVDRLQPIKWLESIKGNMYQEFSYVKELIITEDENRRTTILNTLNDTNKETEKLQAQYENTYITSEEKKLLNQYKEKLTNYKKHRDQMLDLIKQNKFNQAYSFYLTTVEPHLSATVGVLKNLSNYNEQLAESVYKDSKRSYKQVINVTIILFTLCFALCILISLFTAKSIINPINSLQNIMSTAGKGDLTITVPKQAAKDITKLNLLVQDDSKNVVNVMGKGQKEIQEGIHAIQNTKLTFHNIVDHITEVTNQIQDITASAEEMSASSEEINSALINISSISQNIVSETEYTSNSSQTQSISVQEITNMSLQMQKLVSELEAFASQFKIKNL